MNVSAIYNPPARPDYRAATLDVPFWADATVSPSSQPIAAPFATEAAARTAAAAFAVQNESSVLLYNRNSQFELYEAWAKPGGIGNAAVPALPFEIGGKVGNDTEPTGIRFRDPAVIALIGAHRVLENTGGSARYRF